MSVRATTKPNSRTEQTDSRITPVTNEPGLTGPGSSLLGQTDGTPASVFNETYKHCPLGPLV